VFRGLGTGLVIPDGWQHEAARALQEGADVVVQAPTGAGKTYIFELLYPALKQRAVFTVPTRALANDKLVEWRGRGWDVGIATGDVAFNLHARVVVATLETQRARLLRGEGPGLLVIDEFQMLGDETRGVHYELAVALAPRHTQLLLLSGSVANPSDVVQWLERIGRRVVLVEHSERPVPLEVRDVESLPDSQFVQSREKWARLAGRVIRAELAPLLIFAPRRKAAEQIAQAIASGVPVRDPLALTAEQESVAGKGLSKLLRQRVAYHHSGLSYAARAGVVEALAKTGQLNVVVATMGLAAGINFSMRSVLVADRRYFAGNFERQVEPDELLQMFGRAGRRGLDDTGYALFTADLPRLADARARRLRRPAQVDWPTFLSVMHAAAQRGEQPYAAAVELSRSLFSTQTVRLGVEHALETGARPCGLWVSDERSRFVRRGVTEMLNSQGYWEQRPNGSEAELGEALVRVNDRWVPALSVPQTLAGIKYGSVCRLPRQLRGLEYGREVPIARAGTNDKYIIVKPFRRIVGRKLIAAAELDCVLNGLLTTFFKPARIIDRVTRNGTISARLDYSSMRVAAHIDSVGRALINPPLRENLPEVCRGCDQLARDQSAAIERSPAYAWRELGLTQPDGTPTARGVIFSFFHGGEGLAIAAALEDESYPVDELIFDLANIRAGPRFAAEDSPMGGRLGILCQRVFARNDYPGYLQMGVPPQYGAGASEIVRDIVENATSRHRFATETLRPGDIERALMEWRSLLRHIVAAPEYPLARWQQVQAAAARYVEQTTSPVVWELPPLLAVQQQRRVPGTFSSR